jgi:hypothetical protein
MKMTRTMLSQESGSEGGHDVDSLIASLRDVDVVISMTVPRPAHII